MARCRRPRGPSAVTDEIHSAGAEIAIEIGASAPEEQWAIGGVGWGDRHRRRRASLLAVASARQFALRRPAAPPSRAFQLRADLVEAGAAPSGACGLPLAASVRGGLSSGEFDAALRDCALPISTRLGDEPLSLRPPAFHPPTKARRLGRRRAPSFSRAARAGSARPASPTRPATAPAVARSTPPWRSRPRRG